MKTKESMKNEIFTLESRELNEGKKVAFIAGGTGIVESAGCNDRNPPGTDISRRSISFYLLSACGGRG